MEATFVLGERMAGHLVEELLEPLSSILDELVLEQPIVIPVPLKCHIPYALCYILNALCNCSALHCEGWNKCGLHVD